MTERGAQGERGPKGDHGQHGTPGAQGERGHQGRGVAVMFVVLAAYVTLLLWVAERHSCLRQEGVRASSLMVAETARDARRQDALEAEKDGNMATARYYRELASKYAAAARESQSLDCSGVFPDTK